jgi:hypothetical protein
MNGELKYSFMGIFLAIFILFAGCTSIQTTHQIISDDTIKVLTEAVSKLDKEQVKKLEEAIKEKLKDEESKKEEQTECISESEKNNDQASREENVGNPLYAESNTSEDVSEVSKLKWTSTGDPHQIVQCYLGHGHDSELFKMIAGLPVDFTCTLGKGITITKPESDDTALITSYPGNHMQARRTHLFLSST